MLHSPGIGWAPPSHVPECSEAWRGAADNPPLHLDLRGRRRGGFVGVDRDSADSCIEIEEAGVELVSLGGGYALVEGVLVRLDEVGEVRFS